MAVKQYQIKTVSFAAKLTTSVMKLAIAIAG